MKCNHEKDMTRKEVLHLIKTLKIHHKTFWSKFDVNTMSICPNCKETLIYRCDIDRTIRMCLEKRDMYMHEWD